MIAALSAMALGLLFAGCTAPWTSTPTPEPHESFSYAKFGDVDPNQDYHPGDAITFTWDAMSNGTVHEAKPDEVILRAGLFGPFDTVDALKQHMSALKMPIMTDEQRAKQAAVTVDPIQTTSWTNETYSSTLTFPENLQSGYYAFVRSSTSTSDRGSTTGEGQTILAGGRAIRLNRDLLAEPEAS